MEKLPYRFSEKQRLQVEDIASETGMNASMIARAAFQLGMNQLRSMDGLTMSLRDTIAVQDARARN